MPNNTFIILGSLFLIAIIVALAGMFKFNYLSSQEGYDVDGNKLKMHATWDLNEDGINDCESNGTCDHTVNYTQARDYIGLSTDDAERVAEINNTMFRVVERDGLPLPATRDYRPGRINAVVESDTVINYDIEGFENEKLPQ